MDHDCRNSVTFQFKNKFQAFLRASREISDSLPDSLDGLVAQAGIHVVIAPGDNLKGGVFTPWRVALYVAGDEASVKNARPLAATHTMIGLLYLSRGGSECPHTTIKTVNIPAYKALLLLDAFWLREVRPANGEPTTIHIHPHMGIEVASIKEERAWRVPGCERACTACPAVRPRARAAGAGLPVLRVPRPGFCFAAARVRRRAAQGR